MPSRCPNRAPVVTIAVALCVLLFFVLPAAAGCGGTGNTAPHTDTGDERAQGSEFLSGRDAPVYSYEVMETYDHDVDNFTQGLVLDGGMLFEGTGLRGRSRLIKTDWSNGEILDTLELDPCYFGEGVTVLGDEVFQLTYTSNLAFVYDRDSLELKRTFTYDTEGWGLTQDGGSLIMSDGTATLFYLDPASGEVAGRVGVSDNLGPVASLNELEYAGGEIYANIWHTDVIAIISPASGEVTGWIDLTGLNPDPENLTGEYVLNGIAWDAGKGRLLVTGKCWPYIYELEPVPAVP